MKALILFLASALAATAALFEVADFRNHARRAGLADLVLECLGERTIALAQQRKLADAQRVDRRGREQLDHLCSLRFRPDELDCIGRLRFIQSDFVDFLRIFSFQREFIQARAEGADLAIEARGPQVHVMGFEIHVLAIVNELYFRRFDGAAALAEGRRRLQRKIALLRDFARQPALAHPFEFFDFGVRRRFARDWQREVVATLQREAPGLFTGTSNVLLARDLNLVPIGTMAHEYLQTWQATGVRLYAMRRGNRPLKAKGIGGPQRKRCEHPVERDGDHLGDLPQARQEALALRVRHPAAVDVQRQVPPSVVALAPPEAIPVVLERERPRGLQRVAQPLLQLGDEPGDAAILAEQARHGGEKQVRSGPGVLDGFQPVSRQLSLATGQLIAFEALAQFVTGGRGRKLSLERVDGEPVVEHVMHPVPPDAASEGEPPGDAIIEAHAKGH